MRRRIGTLRDISKYKERDRNSKAGREGGEIRESERGRESKQTQMQRQRAGERLLSRLKEILTTGHVNEQQ